MSSSTLNATSVKCAIVVQDSDFGVVCYFHVLTWETLDSISAYPNKG